MWLIQSIRNRLPLFTGYFSQFVTDHMPQSIITYMDPISAPPTRNDVVQETMSRLELQRRHIKDMLLQPMTLLSPWKHTPFKLCKLLCLTNSSYCLVTSIWRSLLWSHRYISSWIRHWISAHWGRCYNLAHLLVSLKGRSIIVVQGSIKSLLVWWNRLFLTGILTC